MTISFLAEIGARSALVLGVGLLAAQTMRRRSAAERHFVLALALGAIVLLPAGFLTFPEWTWKVRAVAAKQPPRRVATTVEQGVPSLPTVASPGASENLSRPQAKHVDPWLAILIFGATLQFVWLAAGGWHLHGIRRRSRRFDLPGDMGIDASRCREIFLSDETRVAFLAGVFRPAIVLPADATGWPAERLRMVLCHELAHLRRRDHWMVSLCGAVRVFYWWNPLAWMALAGLRRERERACDDMVIERFRASDYAELLLVAARAAGPGHVPPPVLAMAAGSNMETRVRAILDVSLSRHATARKTACGIAIAAIGIAMPASTVRLVAAENQAPIMPGNSTEKASASPPAQSAAHDGRQVWVEAKLIDLSEQMAEKFSGTLDPVMNAKGAVSPEILDACLHALSQAKGVDLLSAPRVSVRSGQKAKIEVTREFKYGVDFERNADGGLNPTRFETRKIGVELEIEPTVHGDRIVLDGLLRLTELEGTTKGEEGVEMPVFDVKEARFLRDVGDGESAGLWTWSRVEEQMVTDRSLVDGSETHSKLTTPKKVAIFLTARLVDPSKTSGSRDAQALSRIAAASSPANQTPPYGTPVEGKPGFVTSP